MKNILVRIFMIILPVLWLTSCEIADYPYYYQGGALDMVIVIDQSGSMNDTPSMYRYPMQDAKNAAKTFVDRMNMDKDQASVITYSDTASMSIALSRDKNAINSAIDAIPSASGGATYIGAGIEMAITEITSGRHNPETKGVIVLLSDGNPNDLGAALASVKKAKDQGIVIVTIGLLAYDNALNQDFLRSAAYSPAYYFYAPSSTELGAIYKEVYQRLNWPYMFD